MWAYNKLEAEVVGGSEKIFRLDIRGIRNVTHLYSSTVQDASLLSHPDTDHI